MGEGPERWVRHGGTKYGERKRKGWGGGEERGVAASETQQSITVEQQQQQQGDDGRSIPPSPSLREKQSCLFNY